MHRSPAPGYGSTRTFGQKLGIYMLGIGIGLLFMGWVQMRKRQAVRQQHHQQLQQENLAPSGGPPASAPAPDAPAADHLSGSTNEDPRGDPDAG